VARCGGALVETLLPAQADDVLAMDECMSCVWEKLFKRWLWTVMGRRTRQILACAIGDRSETTARHLWDARITYSVTTTISRNFSLVRLNGGIGCCLGVLRSLAAVPALPAAAGERNPTPAPAGPPPEAVAEAHAQD
jgi:hypothetical protein